MKKVVALFSLLLAVLLTACGAPQNLDKSSASQELIKGMKASNRGDFPTVLREFRPLAESGNVDAQLMLGLMHAEGRGFPQDYDVAAKWYRKTAEQGEADAQFNLSFMYAEAQDPDWIAYRAKSAQEGNVQYQENKIARPTSFSPITVKQV